MVYSINIVKIRYLTDFQPVKIIQNSGNYNFKFFTVLYHGTLPWDNSPQFTPIFSEYLSFTINYNTSKNQPGQSGYLEVSDFPNTLTVYRPGNIDSSPQLLHTPYLNIFKYIQISNVYSYSFAACLADLDQRGRLELDFSR